MTQIRVLVVDDSALWRGVITRALAPYPQIAVVGTAPNGVVALAKLEKLAPDVMVLDIEMPEMDGLTTVVHARRQFPGVQIIMFSSLSERGAASTIEALARGAGDYALKPGRGDDTGERSVGALLAPKVVALFRSPRRPPFGPLAAPGPLSPAMQAAPAILRSTPLARKMPATIVAIASSTGGPSALGEIIPCLPADLAVPVVVVQHMPPTFTRCLAERLNQRAQVRVVESTSGEVVRAGTVYLAPGDFHLELVRDASIVRTRLTSEAPENSCRPAADVLFRSVAQVYGAGALCVVLTGMGSDGTAGARAVVQAGGSVIAQSGPSCVVWGMPKAVEEAGLCDAIVPLSELGMAISLRVAAQTFESSKQAGR